MHSLVLANLLTNNPSVTHHKQCSGTSWVHFMDETIQYCFTTCGQRNKDYKVKKKKNSDCTLMTFLGANDKTPDTII